MEKEDMVFLVKNEEAVAREEYFDEITTEEATPSGASTGEDIMIAWEAPEAEHIEKSTTWYWASMAVAIVLIAIALWQKNFLFAVFIVIAELAVFMFAGEKPKIWEFTIDEEGVTIEGHKTYKYSTITLYDIHQFSDEYKELVLQTTSKVHHYLKIFIHTEDEKKIREALNKKVPHGEIEVSFMEFLERLIGL